MAEDKPFDPKSNLIPVKPGEIRNPWGKAGKDGTKGKTVRSVLKELMSAPPSRQELDTIPNHIAPMLEEQLGRPPTRADLMAMVMLARATGGDLAAWTAVVDRVEGKPMQHTKTEVTAVSYETFLQNTQDQIEGNEDGKETEVQQRQEVRLPASSGDKETPED